MSTPQYIALKPCTLAGQRFMKDDPIPEGLLDERGAATAQSYGLITRTSMDVAIAVEFSPSDVVIPIISEDGQGDPASFAAEAIGTVFAVLQQPEEQATGMIQYMSDAVTLELLARVEHRSCVQTAIMERIKTLSTPQKDERIDEPKQEPQHPEVSQPVPEQEDNKPAKPKK